jgi:hypothetical protein
MNNKRKKKEKKSKSMMIYSLLEPIVNTSLANKNNCKVTQSFIESLL